MIEFISQNISWIKDGFTTIFALTGTILAILTYRRARHSILQPIRNEVIKKQSSLLTDLLKTCQPGSEFDRNLDYFNLVRVNVYLHLKEFGFLFKDQKKTIDFISEAVSGWTPVGNSIVLKDVEVVGTFQKKSDLPENDQPYGKHKYAEAMNGNIIIDKIFLTKDHDVFIQRVRGLVNDPFMPKSIQTALKELLEEVDNNLTLVLPKVIKNFVAEFCSKSSKNEGYPKFEVSGVFNEFNHVRSHHREKIHKIMVEIRSYLKIDETWD